MKHIIYEYVDLKQIELFRTFRIVSKIKRNIIILLIIYTKQQNKNMMFNEIKFCKSQDTICGCEVLNHMHQTYLRELALHITVVFINVFTNG